MIPAELTTDDRPQTLGAPAASRPETGRASLSVVLPALNEGLAIARVLEEVFAALREWPEGVELLVVDDGSHDATAQIATAHGAQVIRRRFTT